MHARERARERERTGKREERETHTRDKGRERGERERERESQYGAIPRRMWKERERAGVGIPNLGRLFLDRRAPIIKFLFRKNSE